jgi:hypothetical protein
MRLIILQSVASPDFIGIKPPYVEYTELKRGELNLFSIAGRSILSERRYAFFFNNKSLIIGSKPVHFPPAYIQWTNPN